MPGVTYSSVLQVCPSTVMFFARLLQQRREARHAVARKRGSYYTWRAAAPARAAKAAEDQVLTGRIREIHQGSRCSLGGR